MDVGETGRLQPGKKFLQRLVTQLNKADSNANNRELRTFGTFGTLGGFIHIQIEEKEDWEGRKYKKEVPIFPRYHQWDVVVNSTQCQF